MKRFLIGFLLGLIVATSAVALADNTVRLFVDGREIVFPEAPPQIINGRTMVPAKPLAEALGAKVEWNSETRSVIVTTLNNQSQLKTREVIDEQEYVEFRDVGDRAKNLHPEWEVSGGGPYDLKIGPATFLLSEVKVLNGRIYLPVELVRARLPMLRF